MFTQLIEELKSYKVVLEPDQNIPEWWAGAPSVVRDDDGTFYLACRMREGNSPRGKRGYEIRILKSADGITFEPIHQLTREAVGITGFERPALLKDPKSGKFKLYGCTGQEKGWAILKFDDADHPAEFKPESAQTVLAVNYPADGFARVNGYKDPVVFWDGVQWHLFVIGMDFIERIWHFISSDGEAWQPASENPVMENIGWHNFYSRPASILPLGVGYLFVYEGSQVQWRDPVYNIATGLAYTPDLQHFSDLTPTGPILKSTTPGEYHTWRYSHWMWVDNKIYVYFEAARPNNTNEIRLGILEKSLSGQNII